MKKLFGIACIVIGTWLYVYGTTSMLEQSSEYKKYKQLIEECEKNLPRNKTCKLVAVEESE